MSSRASSGFAPAFARQRQNDDDVDDNNEENPYNRRFKFMRTASNNIYEDMQNFTASPGAPSIKIGDDYIAPAVDAQFLNDSEIMNVDSKQKTAFQIRNAAYVGDFTGTQIVSEIGNQTLRMDRKNDDRVNRTDCNGNYISGTSQGKPLKRHLQEKSRLIEGRDSEKLHLNRIYLEWTALSPEDQDRRLAENRRNTKATLTSLVLEEIEEVPLELTIDLADLTRKVKEYQLSQSSELSHIRHPHVPPSTASIDSPTNLRFIQDNESWVDDGSVRRSRDETSMRSIVRGRSISPEVRSGSMSKLRAYRRTDQTAKQPVIGTNSYDRSIETTTHTFTPSNVPKVIPIEDGVQPVAILDFDHSITNDLIQHESDRNPRVVSVALADKNVHFSSAAILQRVFGGALQEIQFFPDKRQGVIVFVDPRDALNFLTHVNCAAKHSGLEYRRLQIGAGWYQGDQSSATLPSQNGILSRILVQNATRTILVNGVNKLIPKDALLETLKSRSDNHIVRAKLIVPKKSYDRGPVLSNSVVLEFASIQQALRAKDQFNDGRVREFESARATFLRDASMTPKPQMQWCECLHCTTPRETEGSNIISDAGWGDVGRVPEQKDIFDRQEPGQSEGSAVLMAERERRRERRSYRPKRDMFLPRDGRNKHEDVKSARPR